MAVICFLSTAPPLMVATATIFLTATNNILMPVTTRISDESLNDEGTNNSAISTQIFVVINICAAAILLQTLVLQHADVKHFVRVSSYGKAQSQRDVTKNQLLSAIQKFTSLNTTGENLQSPDPNRK